MDKKDNKGKPPNETVAINAFDHIKIVDKSTKKEVLNTRG